MTVLYMISVYVYTPTKAITLKCMIAYIRESLNDQESFNEQWSHVPLSPTP